MVNDPRCTGDPISLGCPSQRCSTSRMGPLLRSAAGLCWAVDGVDIGTVCHGNTRLHGRPAWPKIRQITVIATLAVMLGAGMALPQAVEMANLAAGIVVGKLGAATVSPAELASKLNKHLFSQGDVYQTPFDKVLQHIEFAKQNGERIVFTNGCFDILHAGHVRYLAQAKALGDRLVVGLNSDASIKRLKGETRPVNPLNERAIVLASLASVDWVLPFGDNLDEQDTPLQLILKVKPDVLVKGGDYSIETIVGATEVLAAGGEVKVLQFVDGCSTSAIIKKIQG